MAFSREFSEREKTYMIEWQHEKYPGLITMELNKWPENQTDPRTTKGVRDFLYRRRKMLTPGDE